MASSQMRDRLKAAENWILANPTPPTQWPWTWLYKIGRTSYALIRDLVSGLLTLHAMGLVYTTLLSIVPLLALSFSVLKAMGVHQRMEPFLFQFFEPMGPQGVQIAEQILGFVDNMKVGVLGSLGLALLVYTVVSLLQKIERSFNMIWRVPDMRSLAQRFSNYLSVIMVGPLLMVSAIGVSATIFSSELVQKLLAIEPFGSAILMVSRLTPFLLVVGAFTFVYIFMPNTRVKLRYAFIGGLVAGVSWQAGGMLFASFVAGSAKYAAIYSSFAIGIILLIWTYLNWMILLLGASLTFYLQNPGSVAKRRQVQLAPELQEKVALSLMWLVSVPFSKGEPAPQQEALEQRLRVPGEVTRGVSDKLIRAGLLSLAGRQGDQLVPGRVLDRITIDDVLTAVRQDEDGVVDRLPFPIPLREIRGEHDLFDKTFAELAKDPDQVDRAVKEGIEIAEQDGNKAQQVETRAKRDEEAARPE
ncbi:YihY/virulence factor BrkB family protein [Marinobacter salinisoli]|uniref:YihY/virulence factor BrkB family protein n=1 Tax=Marinobacter salinisoli TaxID=2769486 RepID=A0ABX7MRC3_9GAMM|nr:YihY/virulence factor BrkB family protein [Marinobacter salinisoli]QSP94897.1 YihY/virulence factor BrkB family protein [Marinobacter salinisoli]